jgi:hypothetical protein
MLLLEFSTFAFTFWLGLYLLARNPASLLLRFAGLGTATYALALALDSLAAYAPADLAVSLTQWRWPILLLPALCWGGALFYLRQSFPAAQTKRSLGVILVATLFFALGLGLLIIPLNWLPRSWVMLSISLDFVALGLAIAVLDAFDEGETLLPDMIRSLASAFFAVLLFGALVISAMVLGVGVTFAMIALLLATTATAIATQVFVDSIQTALDRLTFFRAPHLRQARADLRAAASALPRLDDALDLKSLDEAEFARLTRRAISQLGDLSRLAASPLTRLPLVTTRLAARGASGDTLDRAIELKAVLAESILRLKPRDKGGFGTSDEWRHYNALYFPYVAGLKPYSLRAEQNGLDPTAHEALAWLRASVPERTLHNWQNAAARLVAKDLRERSAQT